MRDVPRFRVRVLARLLAVLAVVGVGWLSSPVPAAAHAVLLSSTPGNWQVLDRAPELVTLEFSEPVDAGLAEVRLIGPDGADVGGISAPEHPDDDASSIVVDLPAELADGTHTVTYRVISADSHPASGAVTFSVRMITGDSASAAAEHAEATGPVAIGFGAAQWVGFAGLALLVGTAFFVAACWPGGSGQRAVSRLFWGGWLALTASTVVGLLLYGPYVAGTSFADVADPALLGTTLSSRLGWVLLARLALLTVVAAAVLVWRRRDEPVADRGRLPAAVVIGTGLLLATTWSLANHGAADELSLVSVPSDAIHLTAMGIWLGGLVVLLGVLLRSGDVNAMRAAVPRFSRVALVCVGVLIVTGTVQAWRQVGTPAALVTTAYGQILLGKLGLVAGLVGLGVLARQWVRRHYEFAITSTADKRRARRGPGASQLARMRRTVLLEVSLAAAVLAVSATLVGIEPARATVTRERAASEPAGGPVNVAVPFEAGGVAGRVAVSVEPGAVGRNEIHIVVIDTAGAPLPVAEVTAEFSLPDRSVGPLPVKLGAFGPGHYIAPAATLPMPGAWQLAVTVRTTDVDQDVLRIPVGAT